jgi:hypothetical protein
MPTVATDASAASVRCTAREGSTVAIVVGDDANPGGHFADGLSAQHREDAEIRALHHHQEQRQRAPAGSPATRRTADRQSEM